MVRVSVVADNMAMRVGLREILNSMPGFVVECAAARVDELCDSTDVLVVVAPVDLEKIKHDQAVLFLTDHPTEILDLLRLDFPVWGALPANASEDELKSAISSMAEGLWVGSPYLVKQIFQFRLKQELNVFESPSSTLTSRETEVLQLAAEEIGRAHV